ncbi:hypothetical protein ACFZDK_53635 [Streptomyces sp. NPDC007901]|uniref:hypothetical protein n=1 Tax=Streptomyces sp. NPDC007901 TaxID=3364785 RepID=UPI0036E2E2E7
MGAHLTAVRRITEHEPHPTLLSSQHLHRRGLVVQESHDDVSVRIEYESDGALAVVMLDKPPQNLFDEEVFAAWEQVVDGLDPL